MKSSCFCFLSLIFFFTNAVFVKAQSLEEGVPVEDNNLRISFKVITKSVKTIKGAQYEKTKIRFKIENIGETDMVNLVDDIDEVSIDFLGSKKNVLIEFFCENATGHRLSSTDFKVKFPAHTVDYKFYGYDKEGKKKVITKYLVTAHVFRKGRVVTEERTFMIPKGQKPEITYSL